VISRAAVFWTLAVLAALAAGAQAWALRWTCDDAYISLRYAEHFVQGHGLVFNLDPSEAPVEGYTNFTWTMLLALGYALGIGGDAIETWSNAWGVGFHVGAVLLLAGTAWQTSGGRAWAPIAACCYAAIHHAASLAPAGLETAMFVLLATAMLRFALYVKCAREAWLAGFVAVLAAMTRPDGGLLAVVLGAFVLHDAIRRGALRLLVGYCAPFLLVFVPYLLWRHGYYGYWVPNTFYAKSAHDPYPGQGLTYLWEFA
jgi:arabinofuranosyltransferase